MASQRRGLQIRAKNGIFKGLEKDGESEWTEPFYFIQGADCQFGLIDQWTKKPPPIGWDEEVRLTRVAVSRINQMHPKPKFFALCGDLVDAYPGESMRSSQEKDFVEEFSKLDGNIPLIFCCGNHDVCNTPTEETIRQFREKFGDDYFSFWAGGMRCLVINSQYYAESSEVQDLRKAHDEWLQRQLIAKEECSHFVIFQHIPWFLRDPQEEDNYFNLPKQVRLEILDRFTAAGVKAIFCGHYHQNVRSFYKGMEQIVTSAMGCPTGDDRPGLMIVKVTKEDIKHKFYAMEDIPTNLDAEKF